MEYVFGIDVGGTTVKIGLFTTDGTLVDKWEIPTNTSNGGKAILPDVAASLEEKMKNADVVVTGEGRLDAQTVMGKAPVGVAALAKKYNAKVIAFAGSVAPEAKVCNRAGIDAFFPIVRGVTTLEEAMKKENAMENIAATAEQVFRLL